jgi:hypothetical protein
MAQIQLSGSVGVPGSAPILGNYNVIFATDANHTMSAAEYSNYFLDVTSSASLTTTRELIAPLTQGQSFVIQNNTTGGQSITIIGSSGTGVTITDGYTVAVVCDGHNYIQIGGTSATSGSFTAGGDLSGSNTDQTVIAIQGNSVYAETLGSTEDGYALIWNADGYWLASPLAGGSATEIQGVPVSATPGTAAQVLMPNTAATQLNWYTITGDIIASTGAPGNLYVSNISGFDGYVFIGATIEGDFSPVSYLVNNIVMGSDANLPLSNTQYNAPILRVTSSVNLTATRQIILPAVTGAQYEVYNNTSGSPGQSLTFIASTGSGVTLSNGLKAIIYFDGTNYVPATTVIGGDLTATNNVSQKVTGLQGNPVASGTLTSVQDGYVLSWNGTNWAAAPASSTVVEGQNYSFSNTSSDISGYDQLLDNATGSQNTLTASTSSSSKVLIKAFATAANNPNVDFIDSGLWEFDFYAFASLTGAFTTTLIFDVYTRTSGGTETLLFSATSSNIQVTSAQLYTLMYNYQSDTIIPTTNRLVIKVSAQSTNVIATTVSFIFDGTTQASLVQTPITGSALQLGGDITGTTSANTLSNIQTVPLTITSLTTGNGLSYNGSNWANSALNLAGGSNYVSGALPVANLAHGTSAQVLMSNATPANTWTSLSGDISLSSSGASTVLAINGTTVPATPSANQVLQATSGTAATWVSPTALGAVTWANDLSGNSTSTSTAQYVSSLSYSSSSAGGVIAINGTGSTLSFAANNTAPSISQASKTTNSGTGNSLTIQAQNETGTASTGGNLVLTSGSGTSADGYVYIEQGGNVGLTLKPTGVVSIANLGTGVVHADSSGNLTSSLVVNADVSSSANIAVNKLAAGTSAQLLLNNATPSPTWTTLSGDVSLTSAGATAVTAIQGQTVTSGSLVKGDVLIASSTSNWAGTAFHWRCLLEQQHAWDLATVTALQGNPLKSGTLGVAQDGNVATWVNGASQIQWIPASIPSTLFSNGELYNISSDSTSLSLTTQSTFYTVPFSHIGSCANITGTTGSAAVLTCNASGLYAVQSNLTVSSGSSNNYEFAVFHDGYQATNITARLDGLGTSNLGVELTGLLMLNIGDTVSVEAECLSAASQTLSIPWANLNIISIGGTTSVGGPTLSALTYPYLASANGGGTAVTIFGTNLSVVDSVEVNNNPAYNVSSTSSSVTFNWPSNAASATPYQIQVTTPAGIATLFNAVYYLPGSVTNAWYANYGFNVGTATWTDVVGGAVTTHVSGGSLNNSWTNGQAGLTASNQDTTTIPTLTSPYAVFLVADTTAGSVGALGIESTGYNLIKGSSSGTVLFSGTLGQGNQTVVNGTPFLYEVYNNGGSSYTRLNGGTASSTFSGSSGSPTGLTFFYIGNTTVNFDAGYFGLVLVASSPTGTDETTVHGIVKAIYGTP